MGLCKIRALLLALVLILSSEFALSEESEYNRILFLMQSGKTDAALELYQQQFIETQQHNFDLLQQLSLILLDQGFRTKNPETQLLTIFGAGISLNEKALYILEEGLSSSIPQIQLISLNFLSQFHNDTADQSLNAALASKDLLIRLEALHHLSEKKSPKVVGQIESLMHKVPAEIHPIFPQLFALVGTDNAIKTMKRLLTNANEKVRIQTVLSAAKYGRDDLLVNIRTLASHHNIPQQEACAFALGEFKDDTSIPRLENIASSGTPTVRLAALTALYKLGKKEVKTTIEEMAKNEDLFAINVLGDIPGSEIVLFELLQKNNTQIKVNAAIALLERQDPRCLPIIAEILLRDSRDLAVVKTSSIGSSLTAWKVVPSARQNFQEDPISFELSLKMREDILNMTIDLPERYFLELADLLFDLQHNELVPALVSLLQRLDTPQAITLLKKYQQKAGAPLIRNYCNLALYKMKEEGDYAANIQDWILNKQDADLIHFRPFIPWELREASTTPYQLTPQETSRLLVESFESLAQSQDDNSISLLLQAIQKGNAKNRYALAGLLMRATN